MDKTNQTFVRELILPGLSGYLKLDIIFFALILVMYVVILIGNGVLIIASIFDSRLHTPMYFFLGNLSFLDICYTSSSVPSTLLSFISKKRNISCSGCAVQMFLGLQWGQQNVCFLILAVLKLACADISLNIVTLAVSNIAFLVLPLLVIIFSYMFILYIILRMKSATGRHKAFSTCSAHLTVVIIFYGTIFFMYAKPKFQDLRGKDNLEATEGLVSMFYGVVTPMLNPIIYSLRNKDVNRKAINL
uniref:Olfactory receptor family 13 subfamily C member 4 n=1 Tax=Saimiri boliviensis boliviensis TaxID=39432 RepID=A0A2K6UDU6_SAIBB